MNKKIWLLILLVSMLLATRQCIKDNETIYKINIPKERYEINVPIKLEKEVPKKEVEEENTPVISTFTTRMTSYYVNDDCNSGNMTASGLSTNDFDINEKGWYTYQGKLVIATASYRLKNWTMTDQAHPYNLYEEITIIIDGVGYQAIVLDVCGYCMWYNRIDLFVSNYDSAVDIYVEVIE